MSASHFKVSTIALGSCICNYNRLYSYLYSEAVLSTGTERWMEGTVQVSQSSENLSEYAGFLLRRTRLSKRRFMAALGLFLLV